MTADLKATAIAIVGALVLTAAPAQADRADVGRPAPPFQAQTLDGRQIALNDLKGKVLLVDFWASWCEPCREEFPEFEALYQDLRDRGLEIVAVSVDRKRQNAVEFVSKYPVTFSVIHDGDHGIAERFKPRAMPTAYIVDQSGVIRFVHLGYQKSYLAKYREEIAALLAEEVTP